MALKLYQLAAQSHKQMMSYVIITPGGEIIVIDGGWREDMPFLWHMLQKCGGEKPHITAWFMTHPHSDHVLALCELLDKKKGQFTLDTLWHHFPEADLLNRGEKGALRAWQAFYDAAAQLPTCVLQQGQTLSFSGADFEVLYVSDPDIVSNTSNNSSCVFRMTGEGKSVLFLGDLGVEGGEKLMQLHEADKLRSDIVQMAHHGQSAVKMDVYNAVRPEICLWCAPKWLHNNNQGCRGYDSGEWDILQVRAHMRSLGVRRHVYGKDGTALLTIDGGRVSISPEDRYFFD